MCASMNSPSIIFLSLVPSSLSAWNMQIAKKKKNVLKRLEKREKKNEKKKCWCWFEYFGRRYFNISFFLQSGIDTQSKVVLFFSLWFLTMPPAVSRCRYTQNHGYTVDLRTSLGSLYEANSWRRMWPELNYPELKPTLVRHHLSTVGGDSSVQQKKCIGGPTRVCKYVCWSEAPTIMITYCCTKWGGRRFERVGLAQDRLSTAWK